MNVLQVENLIRSYRKSVIKESEEDVKVLKRISFQVAEGEFVGIMAVNRVPVLKRCRSLGMDPVYLGIDKKSNRQLKRSNRKMCAKRVRGGESLIVTVLQMDFQGQGENE